MKNGRKTNWTKRQRKFVQALLDPNVNTVTEAARVAGYLRKATGYDLLNLPHIKSSLEHFRRLLDAAGATDEVLAYRLAEGLHVKKVNISGEATGLDYEQIGKYLDR